MIPATPSPGGKTPIPDADSYPHILDSIVQAAPYPALLAFRATSRAFRHKVALRLLDHILVFSDWRIASRLGSGGRLPFLNLEWTSNWELARAVRVVDVQSGNVADIAQLTARQTAVQQTNFGFFLETSEHCQCAWERGDPLLGDLCSIPVLRRFGSHTCGKLDAEKSIVYTDPLSTDAIDAENSNMSADPSYLLEPNGEGHRTCVIHLPSQRSLLAYGRLFTARTPFEALVLRRRSKAPQQVALPLSEVEKIVRFIGLFLRKCKWDLSAFRIIFVDGGAAGRPSGHGELPAQRFVSFDPTTVRAYFKSDNVYPNLQRFNTDANLLFMTVDEYRQSIGDEAFDLEEDDHGFDFKSDTML